MTFCFRLLTKEGRRPYLFMLFQFPDKQDCFLFNPNSAAEFPLALGRGQMHINGVKGR